MLLYQNGITYFLPRRNRLILKESDVHRLAPVPKTNFSSMCHIKYL